MKAACSLLVLGLLWGLSPASRQELEAGTTADRGIVVVDTFSEELEGGSGGMEVDAEGFVYCADFGVRLGGGPPGSKIYRLDARGRATVFARGLHGASGNAIGPSGAFFQSNIAGNFISRIDSDGTVSVFARKNFESPVGIAIDDEGTLFVANCGSASIVEVSSDGETSVFCSSELLACPNGITLDPEHNLYVANFNNGDVIKIGWDGEAEKLATLPGENNGHLIYHEGFLYVVARGAHRIFKVSLDGEVSLFAGSGERGRVDGPAREARFSFPNDIAVSPDGKAFYVNENASTTKPHTELGPMIVRRIRITS